MLTPVQNQVSARGTTLPRVDPLEMRSVMARIPTSVSVVAAVDDSGPAAMVIGSFVSVSLDPPLVGFFVTEGSTSWPQIRSARTVGISTLSDQHAELCDLITKKHPSRFAPERWMTHDSGALLVQHAMTTVTCRVASVTDAGDHLFVLCRVDSLEASTSAAPLIFHDRKLVGLPTPN